MLIILEVSGVRKDFIPTHFTLDNYAIQEVLFMFRKPHEGVNLDEKPMFNDPWHRESVSAGANHQIRKRFINCKCPKCSMYHDVYMHWAGRGTPRKYCVACKNMVSGYDETVFLETSAAFPRYRGRKATNHAVD